MVARGISNMVVTILMLAVVVPVGIYIYERAVSSIRPLDVSVEPIVLAYAFYTGTDYAIYIYNYGPSNATVLHILDTNMNVVSISCQPIAPGTYCSASISSKPSLLIIKEKSSPISIKAINYQ